MARTNVSTTRAAVIKIAQILSNQQIAVTQRGSMAFCEADEDGRPARINLPSLPDDAGERVLRATQGFLDHEVGHALFTDFSVVREAGAESPLLKMLHNVVEDTLIERMMAGRFRGSEYNLEQTRLFVLEEHITPVLERLRGEGAGEADLFALLLMPAARAWAGQEVMADYMADKWRLVKNHTALLADLVERFSTVKDSASALVLARAVYERLERDAPETFRLMCEYAAKAEAALAAEAADLADAGMTAEIEGAESGLPFERALAKALSRSVEGESAGAEWRPFTTDYDRIEPMPLDGGDWSEALARMKGEIDGMVGPMARTIERVVASQKLAHWLGGRRGGRLNASALHRAPLGDPRLFRQRMERQARDAAVSLVVDMSGSMAGKRVWIACAAALALSETLTRAGVPHEAIGFTTLDPEQALDERAKKELRGAEARARARRQAEAGAGRPRRQGRGRRAYSRHEPLFLPLLKAFDERLGPAIRPRFAAAAQRNELLRNNIDHECLRRAGLRLAARGERRRVMIVFSDGEPAFDGDVATAQKLLRQEVAALERGGLEVYGVGVESESVKTYYPRHAVIERIEDLPGALMRLVRTALS